MPTTYAIPNGRTAMDATLFTSNGGVQTVNNSDNGTVGFKPDLVWTKSRTTTDGNDLNDSVRGASKYLVSFSTAAETTDANFITSFNSNGFSIGTSNYSNGQSIVGWQWVAGQGVNNTNNVGSITSTVSSNTTTGFSIVTYTGTGASGTVGHGLSVAPKFVIYKARNSATWNWLVNIGAITGTQGDYVYLNSTQQKLNSSNVLNATSTTLPLATSPENNQSGTTFVAYCWAEVAGFSQFGSYTGNGSNDGPFVYCGFRPKFVLIKRTDTASNWEINDSSRDSSNVVGQDLSPNLSAAESSDAPVQDFLSNGFKLRNGSYPSFNASGGTYIYACFAENPFKYANAR